MNRGHLISTSRRSPLSIRISRPR